MLAYSNPPAHTRARAHTHTHTHGVGVGAQLKGRAEVEFTIKKADPEAQFDIEGVWCGVRALLVAVRARPTP